MVIIDRTSETAAVTHTKNNRCIFSGCNTAARRNTAAVRAVMLHQTGFLTTSLDRMDYVIANYAVMQDGRVVRLRPLEHMLNSIGTNERAIDIEFVGNYPDWQQVRRASPGTSLPTPPFEQIRRGRELVEWLKQEHGVSEVYGHAQFTPKNCCGPHLWYNVGEWAIDNLGMTNTRGRQDVRRVWGRSVYEIEPTPDTTAVEVNAADSEDIDDEETEAEGTASPRPVRWVRWECWLSKPSRARRVKLVGGGVIGVFDSEAAAAAEAQVDRPWAKPWGWENWMRKPSRAIRLKMYNGGVIGVYRRREDAVAERQRGGGFWQKLPPH